jgi:acyl-CoA-binding protein
MTQALPQDVQLRLYACYKQATLYFRTKTNTLSFKGCFKTNALMQISHLTTDEAKEQYIEIINS